MVLDPCVLILTFFAPLNKTYYPQDEHFMMSNFFHRLVL